MKAFRLQKIELIFLAVMVLLGSFLRLYRIEDTLMFLGDQGRDAIIAKEILKDRDIALIGPVTSVGNMYLGPFYYYFMVPWLAASYPSPIGPAIAVAILGILTIPAVYFIAKKMLGKTEAFFATALFTTSTVVIEQVRFSWNPNLGAIIGLLIFYLLYKTIKGKKYTYITLATIFYSIIVQLHYMAALLGGVIAIVVIKEFISQKGHRKSIIINSIVSVVIFILSLTPLVVFNQRHDGAISKGFRSFITSSEEHIRPTGRIGKVIQDFNGNAQKITTQTYGSKTYPIDQVGVITLLILWIYMAKFSPLQKESKFTISLWMGFTILSISLYSSSIFMHYLSFNQAVTYIFLGGILAFIYKSKFIPVKITSLLIAGTIIALNLSNTPSIYAGKSNLSGVKKASQSILERVGPKEKYNIVLISGTGDIDGQNYRYFLETSTKSPLSKEKRGEVETLFIIQEDYFDTKVTDSPIYEIVVFPNKEPSEVYTIDDGPIITVLKV